SPAARAGVRPGDLIVGFDGERTESIAAYLERAARVLAGDEVKLAIARRGELSFRAVGLEPKQVAAMLRRRLGVEVRPFQARAVVVAGVARGGIADRIGIRAGDAILQVGSREI